jgi:hypothetical protein
MKTKEQFVDAPLDLLILYPLGHFVFQTGGGLKP